MSIRIGAHLSIAGGFNQVPQRALNTDCQTFQIFSRNPRTLKAKQPIDAEDASLFIDGISQNDLGPVVIHTNYLINVASPEDEKYELAIEALEDELERADVLKAQYLILHPGHAKGTSTEAAARRISNALHKACTKKSPKVKICLENMAGAGTEFGRNFGELAMVMQMCDSREHLGVCLDTCHAFASGYDVTTNEGLDTMIQEIEQTVKLENLCVIHANDSVGSMGLRKDRHANIGEGMIGLDGFRNIVNKFKNYDLPFIVETPANSLEDHKRDIGILRSLAMEG